ncbi:MAG: alpha-galactosidase [Bacteroidales bacterium]|nr:alpha-galactosidase [Candidatus Cryptobacteroides onthequi]
MKRLISLLLSTLCIAAAAQNSIGHTGQIPDCRQWAGSVFSRSELPPFSFVYGGVPSSEFLTRWKFSGTGFKAGSPSAVVGTELSSKAAYTWTDRRTGLEVRCELTLFDDFNAAEWVLFFRNTGTEDTPVLSQIRTLDLTQCSRSAGDWQVFYSDGPYFGRADFQSRDTVLTPGGSRHLEPFGGRSSSHTMPYFNVKTPSGGMVYALGWTGSWCADILRDGRGMHVKAGLRDFESVLRPGEEIRVASVAMIPWTGSDRMDGQNLFRRFVMQHHHPKASGRPVGPMLLNSFDLTGPWPCDEYACMTGPLAQAVIRQFDFLGTKTGGFWLDAGWYSRAGDWKKGYWWHSAVGNWTPDPVRFPEGLAPVAEEAHATGGKFLLWYEPERANVDSDWAHEHPEWMLAESGKKAVPMDTPVDSAFIVNLGDPEALDFVCHEILQSITSNKVDIYRQDFNIDPEMFWLNNDEPGRRGMCEVKYINGLYHYLDFLREQLPFLVVDNCAGGGRRLDLEMISRSVSLWRSDYTLDPEAKQCHAYYLHQWLPYHCTNTGNKNPYVWRSALGPAACLCFGIAGKGKASVEDQLAVIAQFSELGPYYLEDYYPLSGYGDITSDGVWMAYQLHRRSDGTGYVIAFRRTESKESCCRVQLRGLDASKAYVLEFRDGDMPSVTVTGKELSEGLTLVSEKAGSSLLVRYSPAL